jgi:hypothetical protein
LITLARLVIFGSGGVDVAICVDPWQLTSVKA